MSSAPSPSRDDSAPETHARPSWSRRIGWTLGGLVGAVLLLIGVFFLLVQTHAGSTYVAQQAAARLNPLEGTRLSIGSASGSWLGHLLLTDVRLTRVDSTSGDTLTMARIDTLDARYRLGALLQNTFHITEATLAGPSAVMRQAPDSSWDWARVLDWGMEEDTTSSHFQVRLDRAAVRDGGWMARFHHTGGDSVATVSDLRIILRDLVAGGGAFGLQLDTLGLRGQAPGDSATLRLQTRASITPNRLRLDTLRLRSPLSRLDAGGRLVRHRTSPDSLPAIRFGLTAAPLAFRDLAVLLPTLNLDPEETVALRLRGQGSRHQVHSTLEARFSNGGRLDATATASPYATPPADSLSLRYRLDMQWANLSTSLLGPRDPAVNRLSGSLRADLGGARLRTLEGPVRFRLSDTRLVGLQTDSLRLGADFRAGTARLSLHAAVNQALVDLDGFLRPLDPVPTFALNGSATNLDVAAFAPAAGITSRVAASFRANGRLAQKGTFNIGIGTTLRPSRIGAQSIVGGEATLRIAPDTLRADTDLTFPDGTLSLKGGAALDGSQRFRLEDGRFEQAPLLALAGDTTAASVTGTVTAEGRRFDPQTMRLTASLALDTLVYDRFRLQPLQTTLSLDQGTLTAPTRATLNGGQWTFTLTGRPFAPTMQWDVADGRFQSVNVAPLVNDTTHTTDLNGTFRAAVRGTDPRTMQLDLDLAFDSSRVNRARLRSGSLSAQLDSSRLTTALTLQTSQGTARLAARAQPFEQRPTYALSEGRLEKIDVAALANLPLDTTSVSARLSLRGRGTTLDDLMLEGRLALDASRVNQAQLSGGTVAVDVREGRASAESDLTVGNGRFRITATVDSLQQQPAYALDLRADTLNLGAFASRASPTDSAAVPVDAQLDTLHWTLRGRGTRLETLTARTSLRIAGLSAAGIQTRGLRMDGRLTRGLLTVDTVDVASNIALLRGSGTIALFDTTTASRFRLSAHATGAAPLRTLVGARRLSIRQGSADLHIRGAADSLALTGTASLQDLFYNTTRLRRASASVSATGSLADGLRHLETTTDVSFISTPSVTVQTARVEAAYDTAVVDLTASARLNPSYTALTEAQIDLREGNENITLQRLDLRLQSDRWSLLQDATITYADAYRVRGLLLLSDDQQIAADGVIDFDGSQSFIVTVEQLRMAPIATLAGLSGLGGRISGTIDLTGAAASPRLNSRLSLDVTSEGDAVGTLRLSMDYADLTTTLDATLSHVDGGRLNIDGSIPTDIRLATPTPVDVSNRSVGLSVRANAFSVGWIDPFVDPTLLRDIQGQLRATVDVAGTLDRPSLSGELQLTEGAAYVTGLDTRYNRATATLTFAGAQAALQEARIRSDNGGRLTASGTIDFAALTLGAFDLSIKANDFIAIDTRAYRTVRVDGTLALQGTTRRPVLNGRIDVDRADIYYAEATGRDESELATVQLTDADERMLEERFDIRLTEADTTTFDAYRALAMDVTVRIERDTWIRSESAPELNIQFTGDLDVTKEPEADAQVFGSIEVVTERSTIRQFGQEFRLDDGSLTFDGNPTTPYLRVTALYEQRAQQTRETEVTITLSLQGRPDNLTPTLSSDPPMETRNILSYLATGRPANQLLSGGEEEGGSLATRVALGQATNFVENLAASQLGLDVVRIQVRPNGTSYLALGRYFTPRFFAFIEQPVTPPTTTTSTASSTSPFVPDLTLEYQLNRFLLLRAQNRQQALNLNVLIEFAY